MKNLNFTNFPAISYAGSQALNTLCTNLSFAGSNTKKIMFTSSHAGEGKSFTSINVMRTLAGLGYDVVLVDADLRRSNLIGKYGITGASKGLTHYLAGKVASEEIVYSTDIPGAYMVPVGKVVINSLSLLNSPLLGKLLEELSASYNYVIVDAPPVGTIIDAAQIAKFCDGVVIVVQYNETSRREVLDVKAQMEQSGCPILGTVLSKVEYDDYLSKKYYYKSYYSKSGYYYGKTDEQKNQ